MKRALQVLLLLAVTAIAGLTSAPRAAQAALLCDNLQGNDCGTVEGRTIVCRWVEGPRGLCVCHSGQWSCS